MKRIICAAMLLMMISGCAYNSRNLIAMFGKKMNFSYGLISVKQVDKIIILRETNSGKGNVTNDLKDIKAYYDSE